MSYVSRFMPQHSFTPYELCQLKFKECFPVKIHKCNQHCITGNPLLSPPPGGGGGGGGVFFFKPRGGGGGGGAYLFQAHVRGGLIETGGLRPRI